MTRFLTACAVFLIYTTVSAQQNNPLAAKDARAQKQWVDSVYNTMNLDQKIGQLFMPRAFSNQGAAHKKELDSLVAKYHVGGIIFSKGGPIRQAKLNNQLQDQAKIPLLMAMDAEWGLAMRLDSTYAFPWNMTLGAIKDNKLVELTGKQIGQHVKRIGMHMNFGPVVDINTNPNNPIIGNRSFGEDKINVTEKAIAFMNGMHSAGVLSSAKHFPGHGDTETDSHKTLPTIDFDIKRLDSVELYPYKRIITEGVSSIMVAHLNVPALETRSNYPSSISKTIVTDLLKEKLQFKGLIFTDALEMKGLANSKEPGDADLAAFLAGNDILLISEDIPVAIGKLKEAYYEELISEKRLEHSVKKILSAKYKVGLNDYEPVNETFLYEDLNTISNDVLYQRLMENAVTVVKNNKAILPIKRINKKKIAYVSLGDDDGSAFLNQLNKYTIVDHVTANHLDELLEKLKNYNYVIVGLHKSNDSPWKSYNFTDKETVWLYEIARNNTTILNVFARPYAMLDLKTNTNIEGIVMAYQNSEIAQNVTAQMLFGAIDAKGKLPVSVGLDFPVGTNYETKSLKRLSYGLPESVGMNSYKLKKMDSLINITLEKEMTPGFQMLIAKDGKVVYNKNFGYHTYEKTQKVTDSSLYDVASLTKILATLPLVMELEENNTINLNTKLKDILPQLSKSNKKNITIKQMLSHYAKLPAWIPFYLHTMDTVTKRASVKYYRDKSDSNFNIQVAENFYIRNDYNDSIYKEIADSELRSRLAYKYSDIPYYILKQYLEDYYGNSLHTITQDHFYEPLGANFTTYTPLNSFSKEQIVPTENDTLWRRQVVQGYVHDQGAAMLGGIGGHAGLFSNANDIAKIMQMYLNGGYYGGQRFLKEETIQKFNKTYYKDKKVRRGVGFDKPQLDEVGPTCGCVPMSSFGHSGFTGTYTWADPDNNLIYIFLSNRTYPFASNRKLISEDIRTKLQRLIYEAIDY